MVKHLYPSFAFEVEVLLLAEPVLVLAELALVLAELVAVLAVLVVPVVLVVLAVLVDLMLVVEMCPWILHPLQEEVVAVVVDLIVEYIEHPRDNRENLVLLEFLDLPARLADLEYRVGRDPLADHDHRYYQAVQVHLADHERPEDLVVQLLPHLLHRVVLVGLAVLAGQVQKLLLHLQVLEVLEGLVDLEAHSHRCDPIALLGLVDQAVQGALEVPEGLVIRVHASDVLFHFAMAPHHYNQYAPYQCTH